MGTYSAICKKTGGGYEIRIIPIGKKVSNFLCAAPNGFGPDDIQYLNIIERPGQRPLVTVDEERRAYQIKASTKRKEVLTWNETSVLGRIKQSFFRG